MLDASQSAIEMASSDTASCVNRRRLGLAFWHGGTRRKLSQCGQPITRASEGGHDGRVMCEIPAELTESARFSPKR